MALSSRYRPKWKPIPEYFSTLPSYEDQIRANDFIFEEGNDKVLRVVGQILNNRNEINGFVVHDINIPNKTWKVYLDDVIFPLDTVGALLRQFDRVETDKEHRNSVSTHRGELQFHAEYMDQWEKKYVQAKIFYQSSRNRSPENGVEMRTLAVSDFSKLRRIPRYKIGQTVFATFEDGHIDMGRVKAWEVGCYLVSFAGFEDMYYMEEHLRPSMQMHSSGRAVDIFGQKNKFWIDSYDLKTDKYLVFDSTKEESEKQMCVAQTGDIQSKVKLNALPRNITFFYQFSRWLERNGDILERMKHDGNFCSSYEARSVMTELYRWQEDIEMHVERAKSDSDFFQKEFIKVNVLEEDEWTAILREREQPV